jgi:hypothetical protein
MDHKIQAMDFKFILKVLKRKQQALLREKQLKAGKGRAWIKKMKY